MRPSLFAIAFFLFLPAVQMGQIPFRVMSYNVENLFDTCDDPETDDNEFLPSSGRRWSPFRYKHKLRQIAQVISAVGEWDTPALVGLCEVENDSVLTHLVSRTPLRSQGYRYCLTQGSDGRGVNVALLYQRDKFRYIGHRSVEIRFKSAAMRPTRDILHVWGEISSGDTLDVLVCHFPSKYGGEKESEGRRWEAARRLRSLCDSLAQARLSPWQILMGDFNESPESDCMQLLVGASHLNLFAGGKAASTGGSQKYQGVWNQLDQIIILRRMKHPQAPIRFVAGSARTYAESFLLTDDKTWRGKRPLRTYHGFKYEAGYSDHLPVVADFLITP
ncbi:MAG: endonuclease [Tannerellaceae bacterium]|jgi:predicted extracellular nuclease|nr:endonuclease [Tannerellaceae bacterium]